MISGTGLPTETFALILFLTAFLVISFLYGTIGHGGATGYLAISALAGLPLQKIRPLALFLNLFVAGSGWYQYNKAGHFRFRLLAPLAIVSIPAAYLGGKIILPPNIFAGILGGILFLVAIRFLFLKQPVSGRTPEDLLDFWTGAAFLGGILGFLAGLTGIGGGVFLSPALLALGWADAKTTAATSAAFIVLNSASGLLALWGPGIFDPLLTVVCLAVVLIGGILGAMWGSRGISTLGLQRVMAGVLVMASIKLLSEA